MVDGLVVLHVLDLVGVALHVSVDMWPERPLMAGPGYIGIRKMTLHQIKWVILIFSQVLSACAYIHMAVVWYVLGVALQVFVDMWMEWAWMAGQQYAEIQ